MVKMVNHDTMPAGLGCSQGIVLDINYHLDCLVDMLWKVYKSFFLSPQTPASYHYYLLNTKSIYCVLILLQYLSQVAKSCSHA
jgi:hypothetical protein